MPSTHLKSKIIITGTGRAGTTFLVRLLTELGLDTGFSRDNWQRHVHAHCSAGMEWDLADPAAPRVVKNPDLCERLGPLIASGRVAVERALVPVRDLDSASASRVRVGVGVPGGVVGTDDPAQQRAVLAGRFHQLVETLAAHGIPVTFLHFPRFAVDAEYCYTQLESVLGGIGWVEFEAAFARVSNPELIHDFRDAAVLREAGRPAAEFRLAQSRRRLRKKARAVVALASVLALGFYWGGAVSTPVPPEPSVLTAAALGTGRSGNPNDRAEPEGLAPGEFATGRPLTATAPRGAQAVDSVGLADSDAALAREPSN